MIESKCTIKNYMTSETVFTDTRGIYAIQPLFPNCCFSVYVTPPPTY
ncbi:hypothetical protein BMETH_1179_0 [methanotrophic bacterial endosymbiont of Bathymodiolus sp.]|nr:hypothetical protein BMETH_1179_0 [methanotrophic bacterial endosymbiont of Bathymodiolus sp.]